MSDLKRFSIATPIGDLKIIMKDDAIILCEFADRQERITHYLAKHHAGGEIIDIPAPKHIRAVIDDYFVSGINNLHTLPVSPSGTEHELLTWNYLRTIPAGTTQSYGEMAKKLASSPRAVGGANGRNAIALLIPCHRIIGADGSLTGYAGGIKRKAWLLRHEGAI